MAGAAHMTGLGWRGSGERGAGGLRSFTARVTGVRPEEAGPVLLSCAYFFCVLAAYYVIRPIRDEMGVAGGADNIPWLFTATFLGMLLAHPLFAAAVSRWPRRRFVGVCYRFFMANLAVFFLLMKALPDSAGIWVGRVFFVWISIFNLFVVSVFWSFMIDIFKERQSKRLFGFIGVGGTLGAVLGSSATAFLAQSVAPVNLLWFSLALMECAVVCVKALDRRSGIVGDPGSRPTLRSAAAGETGPSGHTDAVRGEPAAGSLSAGEAGPRGAAAVIGGGAMDGIRRVAGSPYLLGICVFMLLFTIGSTFLYRIQADIMSQAFPDRSQRTAVFASLDLAVNVLVLFTQLFLTGRLVKRLGVGLTLAIVPLLSLAGFATLGAAPLFLVFAVLQVLRRAGEYAVQRPAREVLYTVLPRPDRYKAKNFNDTLVYRTGDQIGVWSYTVAGTLGLGMAASAVAMVPLSAAGLLVALWLGRRQRAESARASAA